MSDSYSLYIYFASNQGVFKKWVIFIKIRANEKKSEAPHTKYKSKFKWNISKWNIKI